MTATVVGGGLAGSEAAWALAERGVRVTLYEMRPAVKTPAHHTDRLAELVCSNSFKSVDLANASMILSGMGPLGELHTFGGKLFAGLYALYSGLILVVASGIVLAPFVHRILHRFHLEEGET